MMKKICYISLRGSIVYDGMGSNTIDGGTKSRFILPYIERRLEKFNEFIYVLPREFDLLRKR